jgi:Tol biopolymer transport system component
MDDSRAPAWSPDGEQLAFVTFGRLAGFEGSLLPTAIRITSNTTANRVLAPNPPFRTHPRSVLGWFPDGQSLLLRCIKNTLCRVDLKTGQFSALLPDVAVPVEQGDIYTTTTRLSHDGRYFYYLVSGADGGPRRIARLDLAGGSANDVASVPVRQLIDLALSADGQQLAFIALLGTPANPQGRALMTVPASGGEPRIVHQPSGGAIRGVTWSLDGRRLFYSSAGDHLQTNDPLSTAPGEWRRDIWTVGIDGSDPRPLGVGLQDEYFLNTHPNGRSLVFMEENYRNELWMLRLPATLGK